MKNLLTWWKNKEEHQKIELNLLAPEGTLRKSYKVWCFGRKNLLIQWECWQEKPKRLIDKKPPNLMETEEENRKMRSTS